MSKKIKLSSLIPDDKNNNKHTAYGMDLLEKSVNKVGIIESITVSNDDKIISGNARHEVIGKNFTKEALVIETDGTQPIIIKRTDIESDTKQFYEASILANTTSKKNIDFDMEVIDALAVEYDIDVVDLGVDIVNEEILEAEEDDFNGTPPKEAITVLGDLYEIGSHRLLCGDSTDSDQVAKLMNGEKADMVFTSPPYNGNTGADRDGKKNMNGLYLNNETDNKTSEDYIQFNADIFNTIKTISSDDLVILYNINYNKNSPSEYIDVVNAGRNVFNLVETIVWEKQLTISLQGDNLTRIYEFIFVLYNNEGKPILNKHKTECERNLWKISNIGANTENHSACFPIALADKGISLYAKTNANIYEPFCGSGTTMVASHQLKRKCYGMELDPKYCDVIVARMIKLDSTLPIKRNGVLLTNSEVLKFTENTSESN